MRLRLFITATFLLLTFMLTAQGKYEKNKIYVQFSHNPAHSPAIQSLMRQYQVQRAVQPYLHLNPNKLRGKQLIEKLHLTYEWELADAQKRDALLLALSQTAGVVYAEKIPLNEIFYTPNDPSFATQWNLAKIDAANAWNISTGSNKVVVAVVDDAVLTTHQDLQANLWQNQAEIPNNGMDDDGNGFIDDRNGWDVADNDNNPSPPAASATNSVFTHGTHCAGIVSASTDNNTGIASIGFKVQIMAVKTLSDATPGPYLTNPYAGVSYAIAAGAHVISMSWGGAGFSATNQLIYDLAYANNIVCIAAAGNSNVSTPMYPASYNHVISVAASNQSDQKASFSNYGSTIDVTAPGVDIYSTLAGSPSSYGNMSGTSMACPLVAGLAGLMRSYNIGASVDFVESCLKNSADNIYPQNPSYSGQLGAGRINAYKALLCMSGPPTADFSADVSHICAGSSVQFQDESYPGITAWSWSFLGGTPASSILQNPLVTYAANGTYPVSLIVTNAQGKDTVVKSGFITVSPPTATLSGGGLVNAGSPAFIQVDFTGTPPFSFVYTDGTNSFPINNISSYTYQFVVNPLVTTTYSLVNMQSSQCAGAVSGSATITVSASCGVGADFQKIWGGSSQDVARAVIQTTDCGYVVAGYTYSFGEGLYDAFLAKLDATGNMSWFKTYGDSTYNTYFHNVTPVSNGYVAVGSWGGPNYVGHSLVVKTDLNGNFLWKQEIECTSAGGAVFATWLGVQEDNMGNILLDGNVAHPVNFNSSGQGFAKLDGATGNVIYFKNLQVNNYETARNSRLTPGQGLIAAGESRSGGVSAGLFDFAFTKTDANGNLVWSKNYGGVENDNGFDVEITPEGGYIGVGVTENFGAAMGDVIVVRADSNGTLLWAKRYGTPLRDVGIRIRNDGNGNFWIAGTTRSSTEQNQALLFKIDSLGNPLWAKSIGGVFNDGENISLDATGDGGAVLVFNTLSFGEGADDVWLIKTNANGFIPCHTDTVLFNVQNINPSVFTANLLTQNANTLVNYPLPVNAYTPPILDSVCTACGIPLAEFDVITNVMAIALINHSLNTTAYSWFFGDGTTDTMKHAVHEYLAPGTYTVTLVAFNECASDTFVRDVNISANPECKHLLQPGPITGKDATIFSRDDAKNSNDGGGNYLWMDTWTWNGNPGAHRGLLEFDLTNICDTANLLQADLSLFYDNALGNQQLGQNDLWVRQITAAWDEYTVTWNNQPTTNTTGQVAIPTMNTNTDLNNLNITPLIQQQITGPNYGMMLQLQIEQTYRRNVFASSDHPNPAFHPLLELTFDPVYAYTHIPANNGKSITICKGDSVQLSLAGYLSPTQTAGASVAQHYYWIPSAGLSCNDCPNPKAAPSTNTTYKAIAYNCPSCADIDTLRVNISQVVAEHDTTICIGGSVQLNAYIPGISAATYTWTPSTALSNAFIANPVASPIQSTYYEVFATDNIGCTSRDTVEIVVSPYPLLPTLRNDSSLCAPPNGGGTVQLPLTYPTNAISDYFYQWQPSGSVSPDPNHPNANGIVNLNPPSSQSFYLTITNSDGCQSRDTLTFSIGICYNIVQNATICQGDTFWVGTSAYTLAGTYVDSLLSLGGYDSTVTTQLTVNPNSAFSQTRSLCQGESYTLNGHIYTQTGIYLDTLTNMWGCDSIVTTHLIVNPLPVISIGNNSPVCEGQKLTLSATGGGTYAWSGPLGFAASQANPTISNKATPQMSGSYKVIVTTSQGCKDSAQTNVLVTPRPDIQKGEISPASCGLPNGKASVWVTGGTMPYSLSWQPNVSTSTTANGILAGEYEVFVEDTNGCKDKLKLQVQDLGSPEALFTSQPLPSDSLIFEGTPIKFQNQSTNAASYSWNFGDGNATTIVNPSNTYYESGYYTVTLIAYDRYHACPDTFALTYHILPPGTLYIPNVFTPNGDGANDYFLMAGLGVAEVELVLYDRWGIEITRLKSLPEMWDGKVEGIPAPEGTYTYKVYARFLDGRTWRRAGTVTLLR